MYASGVLRDGGRKARGGHQADGQVEKMNQIASMETFNPNWVELAGHKQPRVAAQGFLMISEFIRSHEEAYRLMQSNIYTIGQVTVHHLKSKKPTLDALEMIRVAVVAMADGAGAMVDDMVDPLKRLCTSRHPATRAAAYETLGVCAFAVLEDEQCDDAIDFIADHTFGVGRRYKTSDVKLGAKMEPNVIVAGLNALTLSLSTQRSVGSFANTHLAALLTFLDHESADVIIAAGRLLGALVQDAGGAMAFKQRRGQMLERVEELKVLCDKSFSKDARKEIKADFRRLGETLDGEFVPEVKTLTVQAKVMQEDGVMMADVRPLELELRSWGAMARYSTISKLMGSHIFTHAHNAGSPVHQMLEVQTCNIAGEGPAASKEDRKAAHAKGRSMKNDVMAATLDGYSL